MKKTRGHPNRGSSRAVGWVMKLLTGGRVDADGISSPGDWYYHGQKAAAPTAWLTRVPMLRSRG